MFLRVRFHFGEIKRPNRVKRWPDWQKMLQPTQNPGFSATVDIENRMQNKTGAAGNFADGIRAQEVQSHGTRHVNHFRTPCRAFL